MQTFKTIEELAKDGHRAAARPEAGADRAGSSSEPATDRHGPGLQPAPALQVEDVSKYFTRKESQAEASRWQRATGGVSKRIAAVSGVSFQVRPGEIFGILGPNGSGKSTLIRLVSTLLVPDSGRIRVFGMDVSQEETKVKRLLNRVSADAAFFKKLSPNENLIYAARLYGMEGAGARQRMREILLRLGLNEHQLNQPLEHMSRGMQQKVAIARAFLSSPILLLLDEPTTGLDPRAKREVQAFIREARAQHEATVLLTTHDMLEAELLCDRIAVVDEGRIMALDTPQGLKQLVGRRNGHEVTLEDVFMELTGKKLEEGEVVEASPEGTEA